MEPKDVKLKRLFGTFKKAMILPYDQGLEHGPTDFFDARFAEDPMHIINIAKKGGYDAMVFHVGNARRYFKDYYGDVPLILKVNGKTSIPDDSEPLSPVTASIDDALELSAIAIGYTLYVGSPRQDEDFEQFAAVREEAHRYGLPVIVWSYPRGKEIKAKGGKDSSFAVEYAARTAAELGADMIKVNVPEVSKNKDAPSPYNRLNVTEEEAIKRVVGAACGIPVIFAGGGMVSDEELLKKAEVCIKAGASGLIFGRNVWQRPLDKAVEITKKIREIMKNRG
ncbi:MAG TPA: fructose-bisphosphate aldolase [Deltaproteobacteria bacterium]|nr:fructose-bisphosphate aldolase [Deltaproteobacteria bacterium]